MTALDDETIALVRFSAAITGGTEAVLRTTIASVAPILRPAWADELLLQSYLFAGFPRMLNAAREWRRIAGHAAPATDEWEAPDAADGWGARGESTCATVYGTMYPKLRENMRTLHPGIDVAMVVEGYGKVLGRPGLDLPRRELCVIAACVAGAQDRQLVSHLHGAINVGVPRGWVDATLDAIQGLASDDMIHRARMLWARVQGK